MPPEQPTDIPALQQKIAELEQTINGLENASKMLVRRDIDLRRAYNDLKKLDTQKSEFVSIAAHQLRTPLTTSQWVHRMILEEDHDNLTERQADLLNRSQKSVEHMHKLIEELMEVDRLEYGNINLKIMQGSIEKLLRNVIDDQQPLALEHEVTIHTHFANETKSVPFDPNKLTEVCGNILDNAIKYTQAGGSITVKTSYTKDNHVCIEVADTGIGIPSQHARDIFRKFTRLDNAERVDANGSGLGLYIAHKIVEKHGGTITFEPNQPTGTVFRITLPC